ncbi:LysM peptidoglycan-binding domain-containing protein [Brevibacillus laterosporus]|nr:LysM domain-containing protein [Brevibacillus laterosporus]TPG89951.1 LysM peptidoglycan-binding domain-containing protein [Brevibacillus laterosporus]
MATINGMEIHVINEKPTYSVKVSEHPVENGAAITDHVEPALKKFAITGLMVGPEAAQTRQNLVNLMNAGEPVTYTGRNIFTKGIIESIETDHHAQIANGMAFTMQIRELRRVEQKFSANLPKQAITNVKLVSTTGRKQVKTTKKGKTATKAKSSQPTGKKHTVRKGQTWESIASQYGVDVKKMRKWNGHIPKSVRLKEGMVITVG